ncbi:hypothetical protein R3W88_014619 [Solanum pinnatisectum]|uniref:Uncharacterized protein n=1 Tax=Solanum pinnatisectum TaxID=50273 RepID=A0AAV9KSS4_9SOLN|nr:hypothetical protein R3W88_014619 [Solanum pinnatisectum]
MLEENTMERIMEREQMLVNTNSMSETINSLRNTLEMDNFGLKKDMEVVMLSTCKHAMNVKNVLAKEQDAIKKCQAADTDKRSFEEDLCTIKLKKTFTAAARESQQASRLLMTCCVLVIASGNSGSSFHLCSPTDKVKQRFQQQAESVKVEREQLRV